MIWCIFAFHPVRSLFHPDKKNSSKKTGGPLTWRPCEDRLTIAKALLRHDYDRDWIISFLVFIKNFLYINDEKINSIFDEQIIQSAGETINMGVIDVIKKQERQEGLQQGAEQKAIGVVKNLIKELGLADEQVARIAEVPVELVRKVRAELNKEK